MKSKLILGLAGFGLVFTLFEVQAINYQKELDKMQLEVAKLEIQNKILQEEVNECKKMENFKANSDRIENFKAKSDRMVIKLLRDFQDFKKSN
jgi:predicted RNase H-like nuclease (RuvC/YqgF family)